MSQRVGPLRVGVGDRGAELEALDLDAAVAITGTNPVIREGGGIEVRPVHRGGAVEPTPV